MNLSKVIALGAIGATVVTVGVRVASAQGAAACNNQPYMAGALQHLRGARGYLDRAEHNKGGWRERAVQATDAAIAETERGCAVSDTH